MDSSEFECLASGIYLEGLTVEPGGGAAWYSDVVTGGIYRVAADGTTARLLPERQWIGGLAIDAHGRVLSSGSGGIMASDPQTGESQWVLAEIAGEPVNGINEMAADGKGGMWFGTLDLAAIIRGAKPGPVGIYHVASDGTLRAMCEGLGFTNGMALSPDGKTLYCNESFDATYAHDVGPDGSLSGRRKFLEKADCDGMAIDAEGNVWITGFASSQIARVAPDGTVLEPFETPGSAVTQLRFGGADMRDIYLVTVPDDAGQKLAAGELPSEPQSFLYRGRSQIAGHVPPQIDLG